MKMTTELCKTCIWGFIAAVYFPSSTPVIHCYNDKVIEQTTDKNKRWVEVPKNKNTCKYWEEKK